MMVRTRGARSALFAGALLLSFSALSGCKGGGGSNAGAATPSASATPSTPAAPSTPSTPSTPATPSTSGTSEPSPPATSTAGRPIQTPVSPAPDAVDGRGVTIAWIAPTQKVDGSALTDLTGFIVSYGASQDVLVHSVLIDNPSVDRFVFDQLAPGTYYFAVRAVTANGDMSELSQLLRKVVG